MEENIKMKIRTIIILIIGAFISFIASYACAVDWIIKLKSGQAWLVNLFYHPITGITSIVFLTLCVILIVEKISPGQIKKIRDYIDGNRRFNLIVILILITSLILLTINSYMLIMQSTSGIEIFRTLHILMGIISGISLTILILKPIANRLLDNSSKWQNYIIIIVIILIVVFIVSVLIAAAMGSLALGSRR